MDIKVSPNSPDVLVAVLKSPVSKYNESKGDAQWFVLGSVNSVSLRHSKGEYSGHASISMLRGSPPGTEPNLTYFLGKHVSKTINVEDVALEAGDFVAVWINNAPQIENIKKSIYTSQLPDISYLSGLKFFGRIKEVNHSTSIDHTGRKSFSQSVSCKSFDELSSQIYYNPFLSNTSELAPFTLSMMIQQRINQLQKRTEANNKDLLTLDTQDMVCSMVALLLGDEVPSTSGKQLDNPILNSKLNDGGLKLPVSVSSLFGYSLVAERYLDLYEVQVGVADYSDGFYQPTTLNSNEYPEQVKQLSNPLLGFIPYFATPWQGTPIWRIIGEFANLPVNEMYTSFRWSGLSQTDLSAPIKPTLVVRQFPFMHSKQSVPATTYDSLPSWKITDELVTQYSWSLSDEMRVNMIAMIPKVESLGATLNQGLISTINPPFNKEDALYNGLKLYMTTVPVASVDLPNGGSTAAQFFNTLLKDRMFDGQNRRIGTLRTVGIIDPISVGDNFEYEGHLHHIESVSHDIGMDHMGRVNFTTSISFTHGTKK
jgi:hypothetical protein